MIVDAHKLAQEHADSVTRQLRDAANTSEDEKEFHGRALDIFQKFADSAGLKLRTRDEYTVASGRAPSLAAVLIQCTIGL